ncbi:endonuclease V-domain-containing protein [Fimicolochytrium jonesii]|uniref:endonuclease V-domain-containing protein n=1 Tax=Fimicolochytrium jonesii TaxID=1396493 RepID=UPI0022FEF0B7|nr:endonuclease V-domain-containing protein [Fimicolochytrium jonesii]KAI8826168.1 endonuclease V-domain-containing protein [Fimicolochytrium jonesii]
MTTQIDAAALQEEWNRQQTDLTARIISHDVLSFHPPPSESSPSFVQHTPHAGGCKARGCDADTNPWPGLKYIAGMDVSFFEGTDEAIGCLVVLSVPGMEQVYVDCQKVTLDTPYIPSYLAFREAPILLRMLQKVRDTLPEVVPQVLMIDGNGVLHPRKCGLACHVGVLADIPAIGVAKNFLQIDSENLVLRNMKDMSKQHLTKAGDWFPIVGEASGEVYGAALRATSDAANPVFVSPGHRISLRTSVELTAWCSVFRVPEPIRAADYASREVVRAVEREAAVKKSEV